MRSCAQLSGTTNAMSQVTGKERRSLRHGGDRGTGVRLRIVIALAVSAVVIGVGSVAVANPFGYPGNYAANNGNHEIYFSVHLDSDLATATELTMTHALNPHPAIHSYRIYVARSSNDVRVYDGNYGATGWYAAAGPCIGSPRGSGQGTYCKPRLVRYNRGQYPGAFDTEAERRHFACHELGHTLGLFHDPGGCMSSSGTSYYFGSHNYDHLYFYD